MIGAQRLILRKPRQDDREFLSKLFSDEAVLHYLAGDSTKLASMLIDDMCAPLAITPKDKEYWIAERTEDGSQVGYASALRYSTPRVEIAFAVSAGFRNRRYGYQLVASLVDHLTTIPHIQILVAVINYFNQHPQRIVQDLGFAQSTPSHWEKSLRTQTMP